MDYDVVVVGAGPAGTAVARHLAERGHSVVVLEEHPIVGEPVQCAGLVHARTFDYTPFPVRDVHENDLHGAIVHSPDGTKVQFRTDRVQAVAMDRALFDQKMADAAREAGAIVRTHCKAVGLDVTPTSAFVHVLHEGQRTTLECKLVVGADGIRSNVARWSGMPHVAEIVSAYEAELDGCTLPDPSMIPMFAGERQAPGFFSWVIPVGDSRARAGLAVAPGMNEAAAKRYYEAMFEDPMSRPYIADARETKLIIGGIPLGIRRQLVADRVALVGDAAGMAKPTSGGGIHTGLMAAQLLAGVVDARLRTDSLSRGDLAKYERLVRRRIAPELHKGWMLRNVYKLLRDPDFNRLAQLLGQPRVQKVIEKHGDIDYPSRLLLPLLLAEWRLGGLFARALLRGRA